ncbi:hypothetical protein [Pseudonocardia sp. GCM10023141]|uniref:hypothetical protein n=1 Tax=Pseudonocardia sp. GCM10023141 TaxID=3252653 RepID=UPI0036178A5E
MADRSLLRQIYDGAERRITPPIEEFVRTGTYADLTATLGQVQGAVTGGIRGATTWFWHLVNLPAGTDVQGLRRQIGALDREVRRLTLQLELQEAQIRTQAEPPAPAPVENPVAKVDEDADPQDFGTAQPVRRARPRAPRGGAQHPPRA